MKKSEDQDNDGFVCVSDVNLGAFFSHYVFLTSVCLVWCLI